MPEDDAEDDDADDADDADDDVDDDEGEKGEGHQREKSNNPNLKGRELYGKNAEKSSKNILSNIMK